MTMHIQQTPHVQWRKTPYKSTCTYFLLLVVGDPSLVSRPRIFTLCSRSGIVDGGASGSGWLRGLPPCGVTGIPLHRYAGISWDAGRKSTLLRPSLVTFVDIQYEDIAREVGGLSEASWNGRHLHRGLGLDGRETLSCPSFREGAEVMV